MLRVALVCLFAGGCAGAFDLEPVPPPPTPTGAYAKTVTIAQPTAARLEDFPLAVLIAADADLAAHVIDGSDIGFEIDGLPLPCEIVRYDGTLGQLEAWVRVPVLESAPEVTELDLIYGLPRAPCAAEEMWTAPHVVVWHGALDNDRARDATSHHHDVAAATPAAAPVEAAGIVGTALRFDGVDDLLCDAVDEDGSLGFDETASFTFGAWVHVTESVANFDMPLYKGGGSVGNPGFQISLGLGEWRASLSDGVRSDTLQVDYSSAPMLGMWHQLVTVIDRGANVATSYVDGSARAVESLDGWGSFVADAPTCLSNTLHKFSGLLDEARVTANASSASRLEVEHLNLAAPADLLSLGDERALAVDADR